jgi:hypothetical protein
MPLNISSFIPLEAKKEILESIMQQASTDIYQVSLELNIDPDNIEQTWTAEESGIPESSVLRSSAERLEFHLNRFYSAKNKLDAL